MFPGCFLSHVTHLHAFHLETLGESLEQDDSLLTWIQPSQVVDWELRCLPRFEMLVGGPWVCQTTREYSKAGLQSEILSTIFLTVGQRCGKNSQLYLESVGFPVRTASEFLEK